MTKPGRARAWVVGQLTHEQSKHSAVLTAHLTRSVLVEKRREKGQKWDPSGRPAMV